uniref:Tll0287-like domain-containing protein n=1 Tax=Candidatus Kentrum sp. TC TaxID=2126339 RepID=A0A451A387_9GAMM|nr:MAG: Protein of unknown function (DUF3365) [Candidatus Kentron sp. TC]VFK47470.1 MAG: Protein of unknown function (DUF3365) [Candidatus Kentron sp. TC]VFK60494.1 MAG: Protein of unknown function (DUF3365) [Candidatus Kentron sp. TC]
MKRISLLLLLSIVSHSTISMDDAGERIAANRQVTKELFTVLKGELEKALETSTPANAIPVCKTKVPQIGKAFKEKYPGWTIGRTSLKTRNPANAPDEWEKGVLEDFEARKVAGEDPKAIEHSAFVEKDGVQVFRYMKAIPTLEVCTLCHGAPLIPDVAAKLDELYPEDQARGFEIGDIRGAFSFMQPVQKK